MRGVVEYAYGIRHTDRLLSASQYHALNANAVCVLCCVSKRAVSLTHHHEKLQNDYSSRYEKCAPCWLHFVITPRVDLTGDR